MSRRTLLLNCLLSLATGSLLGQVHPEERIPIRDPDRLQALGFPGDASNVYVWSRATLGRFQTGQAPALSDEPEAWGTGIGYSTVPGHQLQERNEVLHMNRTTQSCWCPSGSFFDGTYAIAQIPVPEGALLGTFRFWAYDLVADQDLSFRVWETCQATGLSDPPTDTLIVETSTLGSIGNYNGAVSLNGLTVNNRLCTYSVQVEFAPDGEDCDPDLAVRKLQFGWTRQVSPAPATATFGDVPTGHAFFQFVEALAASGITGGCGAGNYCPDAPLTRGQMAVFLAKALGLQWP